MSQFRRRPKDAPPRRQRESGEFDSVVIERPAARMATGMATELPRTVVKAEFIRSEGWRRAVASIPCVVCGSPMTQAAHRNEGKGMGIKTHDVWTAALCHEHHAAIDSGRDMDRAERREAMDEAILLTLVELFKTGKVRVA